RVQVAVRTGPLFVIFCAGFRAVGAYWVIDGVCVQRGNGKIFANTQRPDQAHGVIGFSYVNVNSPSDGAVIVFHGVDGAHDDRVADFVEPNTQGGSIQRGQLQ